ncbi:MAG: tRNA dihydrouridine synthase DusB [Bacillota bacterium]
MKIGNLTLQTNAILPAIAGYSDVGMRMLCSEFGAGITYTEMVSAKGLLFNNENTKALLATSDYESIKGVQLFGREPELIARAIQMKELAKFDIIDINMGCPMPKIYKNGEGSALMREPKLVEEIVRAAVNASGGRPVTGKIRAGFSGDEINAVEVALAIQAGGGSAVTVHGRTRDMLYSGYADLSIIADVKKAVSIPVIGNGDVVDRASFLKMTEQTGVDGVAIARGAVGRPQIFAEVQGTEVEVIPAELIKRHINALIGSMPERVVVNTMKKHIASYYKGSRGDKQLRLAIMKATSLNDIYEVLH